MKQWRIYSILSLIILFGTAVIGRLIFLQIINYDYYKALAIGQQNIFGKNQAERGEIYLQNRENILYPLAINKNRGLVYASLKEIDNPALTALILSKILELDQLEILEKLVSFNNPYQVIKRELINQEEKLLQQSRLPGIYLKNEIIRYYPQNELASQTIGFLGGEDKGQYGIEGYYDALLKGEKKDYSLDEFFWKAKVSYELKQAGTIILSLDYNIQAMAEDLLKKYYKNLGFKKAQIIVASPKTGAITALAHFPNFNPNNYETESDWSIFQNMALQNTFEPGSIFKPITMAAALEEESITPETSYYDSGNEKIGGSTIYNYDERVWGKQTMTEVLEKSINTGAVFVERKLGHEKFLDYIERFGFFEPTNIDLQGEIFSTNAEFKKGYEINFATASFGQGIEVTPMQLVSAFSAIANEGKPVKIHLVKEVKSNGKSFTLTEKDYLVKQNPLISAKTASQLTAMMVSVVNNGFAKGAQVPGYYVAGKTGTAQITYSALGINRRGYSDETIQTFIGFAPAFDAQFLILVKLNNPQTKTAEYSTVPIFQELAKYIIDYYQIPPDYE